MGRWVCVEIAVSAGQCRSVQVSAGQCSHPFQVSAGISSAQAEQSHNPFLKELVRPAHRLGCMLQ